MSRWVWNISKEEDFLGKLRQCSVTLTMERCFLMFWGNLLCLSLCPWPVIMAREHWEQPGSVHLAPPFQYLYILRRFPWAFSSPGWRGPSSFSLSWEEKVPSSSLLTFLAFHWMVSSPLYWGAQNWAQSCSCDLSRGAGSAPQPPGNAPLIPEDIHCLCPKDTLLAHVVSRTTGCLRKGRTALVCAGSDRNNCLFSKSWQPTFFSWGHLVANISHYWQ